MDGESESVNFCIGHHDASRAISGSYQELQVARGLNYDMITTTITTPHFHSRVLALLSDSIAENSLEVNGQPTRATGDELITIPPLVPADSFLSPHESTNQVVAMTATWTDLTSLDPVIADISKQILKLELNYAAFCGITYALIPAPRITRNSASAIIQYARAILEALSYGAYMNISISMPMVADPSGSQDKMGDLTPFARKIYQDLEHTTDSSFLDLFGSWSSWETIRSMCNYHHRLSLDLGIPKLLPPVYLQSRWFSEPIRFLSLSASTFSKNLKGYPALSKAHQALISQFTRVKFPPWFLISDIGPLPGILDQTHDVVHDSIAVTDAVAFPTPAEAFTNSQGHATHFKDPTPHLSYLRNLQTKLPPRDPVERFTSGYQDYLQAPLQPLTTNLESTTYEVFEKDPIKYDWYERAIARALHDWIELGKPASGEDGRVVVAVVGAGRGPLVTRALKAAEDVDVEIDMWALEKNPNAFLLLQRHNLGVWGHRVNLVRSDMRSWKGPLRQAPDPQDPTHQAAVQKALQSQPTTFTGDASIDQNWLLATGTNNQTFYKIDILISELLGSFGDNELSPECLDGVQHLLNPTHGISIPASYSAHLTPIAAPKLHASILSQVSANPAAPETPYVVLLHAIDYLSTTQPTAASNEKINLNAPVEANPTHKSDLAASPIPQIKHAWSFSHPLRSLPHPPTTNAHNARHTVLHFPAPHRGSCHGLAGYFETVLYRNSSGTQAVELSTNPLTMPAKSADMISWFPIYFPLRTPVYVPDGGELVVNMWRQTDDATRKVWYEWCVDVFAVETVAPAARVLGGAEEKAKGKEAGKGKGRGKEQAQRGRKFRVGGSALHTSIKDACLM